MGKEQIPLFHDSIFKALETCVMALGGSKEVGPKLWGESASPVDLGRKVDHCLNPNHAQKFCLTEMLWILTKAQKAGCHAGANFINRECGYADPLPIEPEDEKAALMRQFNSSAKGLQAMLARIEKLA